MSKRADSALNRRHFAASLVTAAGGVVIRPVPAKAQDRKTVAPESVPFPPAEIQFRRRPVMPKVEPFAPDEVALLDSVFQESAQANLRYLRELNADRLLHNFRLNAGLPSSAQPLGGWEKPDCELRGHFVGHFLSACALAHAAQPDRELKRKSDYLVAELAKCQAALSKSTPGYLSAFPISYFDRLDQRTKVWAPFYTLHKIMAGLYDMNTLAGNGQALEVLRGLAQWADGWTAQKPEAHMQDILNTEYGGMNDILYKLAALTGEDRYVTVGDRFTKKKFFNPLAMRRDELRGLHANTHIPQVIGAAQRYELSGDHRFRDVAEFFWAEVSGPRSYATGGTSNDEHWLVDAGLLADELKRSAATTEDCCAYNMLKLTRQLYQWNADPRLFDYYERTLWNHRLPAIDRRSGATQYYLSVFPNAWKTFGTANDSFWCCTGSGVEEFAKLNDSIYYHGSDGLYVNLFIPSELNSKKQGLSLKQQTKFPENGLTTLIVTAATSAKTNLHLRIPAWAGNEAVVSVNGEQQDVVPAPGSYFTLARKWKTSDRVELRLPMKLRIEPMPDDPSVAAVFYGPLVLAGQMGTEGLTAASTVGPEGPEIKPEAFDLPRLSAKSVQVSESAPLEFRASGDKGQVTLRPFYQTFDTRYSIYWRMV